MGLCPWGTPKAGSLRLLGQISLWKVSSNLLPERSSWLLVLGTGCAKKAEKSQHVKSELALTVSVLSNGTQSSMMPGITYFILSQITLYPDLC